MGDALDGIAGSAEMTLMIGLSVADIFVAEKIITKYMEENNIKDINEIEKPEHETIIQERYDKIMKELINAINPRKE